MPVRGDEVAGHLHEIQSVGGVDRIFPAEMKTGSRPVAAKTPVVLHGSILSGSLLPVQRVAAGVETGNHDQGVIFDNKKERVREAAQEGRAFHR